MERTSLDIAIETAAGMVANCTDGTTVCVTSATPDATTESVRVRAAEAVAARFGVNVAVKRVAGGITFRFTARSAGSVGPNVLANTHPGHGRTACATAHGNGGVLRHIRAALMRITDQPE